jgi:hypothetical protein
MTPDTMLSRGRVSQPEIHTPENNFASRTFRGENVEKIHHRTALKQALAVLGGFAAAGVMLLAFLSWITVVLG